MIAPSRKSGRTNVGMANHPASATGLKWTSPSGKDSAYPAMTPSNTGIAARKPRNTTEPKTTTASVVSETATAFGAMNSDGLFASGTSPAIFAATGASSRPMIATIAPIAAGGNTTFSQPIPTRPIRNAISMNTMPAQTKPDSAAA